MRLPCLWRCRSFHLSGRLSKYMQSERSWAVGYADNLGVFLESLEVTVCPPKSVVMARRLHNTICRLLNTLVRVQAPLKSLSIVRLELDRFCWDEGLRNTLVKKLIYFFLKGPSRLKNVCLIRIRTETQQGLELLSAIVQNQRSLSPFCSLSSLDLRGFFSATVPNQLNNSIPQMLQKLQSLTHLALSYSWLSDELLLALSESIRARRVNYGRDGNFLESFSLYCTQNEPHQQVVYGYSWATLVSSSPDLKVRLTLEQIVDTHELVRILLPEIPLVEYNMTAFYSIDENCSAKPLLQTILPWYRHSLQNLTLDLSNCSESLDDELLELVNVCECLVDLRVWAFLEISTVSRLLHIRMTKRMLLNKIKVRIYTMVENIEEQEDQLMEILSPFCYPPELQFLAVICPYI
ncbi:F-box only protein 39 [Poecilia reticulata]|uniref:F-box only protein 39 n=1 Tax=Poecilia reticulata TaxID=8081 RepID=UPI0007EBC2B5|nr:PREDICTED: F-box only protein 39 [Poecilia reticulata]